MMSTLNKISELIEHINPEQNLLYKKWNIQHRDELFTQLYWSHHPMTEKYYFEANPSFYYEYKNIFDLGRYPIVMLRDGFLGILEFFLLHPKPHKDIDTTLLIPKQFECLVPKLWENQIASYNIYQKNPREDEKADQIFIYGTPTEELFIRKSHAEMAKEISEVIKPYKEYKIYFPIRDSILSNAEGKEKLFYIKFVKEIYRHVGFDANIFFHHIHENLKSLEGKKFDFYNLDKSKILIEDNYLDHFLYSIGGKNYIETTKISSGLNYDLSKGHAIEIQEIDFTKNCFSEFFLNFKLTGQRTRSIYEIFKDKTIRELYLKNFS